MIGTFLAKPQQTKAQMETKYMTMTGPKNAGFKKIGWIDLVWRTANTNNAVKMS